MQRDESCLDFGQCEWLGEIVVRAEFECLQTAVEFAAGRQDEDRRSTYKMPAQDIEDLETVGAGQAEVEDIKS